MKLDDIPEGPLTKPEVEEATTMLMGTVMCSDSLNYDFQTIRNGVGFKAWAGTCGGFGSL